MKSPFQFSITDTVRKSWDIFTGHPWFFSVLAGVKILLNFPTTTTGRHHTLLSIFVSLVSFMFSYMLLSVFLAAVDEKHDLLTFGMLHRHVPTIKQLFLLLVVAILVALLGVLGLIVLIIPGIYILVRLVFAQFAYVDRQGRPIEAIKYSWHLVGRDVFWKVFLTCLTVVALVICGAILFGVGFLVTYPLAMLLLAQLYRALAARTASEGGEHTVQPIELSEPQDGGK